MLSQLTRRSISWGLLAAFLAGCAALKAPPEQRAIEPPVASQAEQPVRWWYLRFRLNRAEEGEVNSFLDALIADQLLAAAIAQYQAEIPLWRFHRRWSDDATGHQFSFIFFAPSPVADELAAQIERDPLLQRLADDGYLVEFRVDAAPADHAQDPAATSDPRWPPAIQREWPKFIMGASRMWLGLVQSEAARHGDLALYPRYRAVETVLDELWFSEGNHAFFHHLSALFGYRPVRVLRPEVMTF